MGGGGDVERGRCRTHVGLPARAARRREAGPPPARAGIFVAIPPQHFCFAVLFVLRICSYQIPWAPKP